MRTARRKGTTRCVATGSRFYVKLEGDRLADVAFEGSGCAISRASASLMTDAVLGLTMAEVDALFARVHRMLTAPVDADVDDTDLGKLAALAGVREFPVRVKCASLPWHTLKAAFAGQGLAKTE